MKTESLPRRRFAAVVLAGSVALATGCSKDTNTNPPQPEGTIVHTVSYLPGPAWKDGEPISAQGLDPHFAFMGDNFRAGALVANGPFGDAIEGFYVFAVDDRGGVDALVDADPAVTAGTLEPHEISPWFLMMDHLDAPARDGESLFVLEYGPGPSWQSGKALSEQPISEHMAYVGKLFEAGTLIAGGPIPQQDRGRYVVSAKNESQAQGARRRRSRRFAGDLQCSGSPLVGCATAIRGKGARLRTRVDRSFPPGLYPDRGRRVVPCRRVWQAAPRSTPTGRKRRSSRVASPRTRVRSPCLRLTGSVGSPCSRRSGAAAWASCTARTTRRSTAALP